MAHMSFEFDGLRFLFIRKVLSLDNHRLHPQHWSCCSTGIKDNISRLAISGIELGKIMSFRHEIRDAFSIDNNSIISSDLWSVNSPDMNPGG